MSAGEPATEVLLRLIRAPGIGPASLRGLIERFGGLSEMLAAWPRGWRGAGLDGRALRAIESVPATELEADLKWLAQPGRHLLSIDDPAYPEPLRREPSAPLALFVHGDVEVLSRPQIAIVGSRNATVQGTHNARAFAAELSRRGLVISSGLALGVDGAAHAGALDAGGITLAVCATGLDRVYPARHRELAYRIVEEGALVSEFPPGVGVRAEHFPRRNRIISAMSLGVLVVEAAERSGSLITARYAAEQGRELFAIPGSIHNPMARGCHKLIRQGAKLVETANDILEEIAAQLPDQPEPPSAVPAAAGESPALGGPARALYAQLDDAPTSVDALVEALGWDAARVGAVLLELELAGLAARAADGRYMRTALRA